MRTVPAAPSAYEVRDHLQAAIERLGASAKATLEAPPKLTMNSRPVMIHIDTFGNDQSGGVFAWRTCERTEGELPRKLMFETVDGDLIGDWRGTVDAWVEELAEVQRRDDDLVARGLDPKRPPASSLTVHRIVHDMLEADGRGGLCDPDLVLEKGSYAMPGLIRDEGAPSGGRLFTVSLRPMGGRLEAEKVGGADFWFEQTDDGCRVVNRRPLDAGRHLPDTVIAGIAGSDLADVIGHASIKRGRYAVLNAQIDEDTEGFNLRVTIGDQQVPLIRD